MRLALIILFALTGAAFGGDLPDSVKTPGQSDPTLTKERICDPKFSTKSVRNVSALTKKQAYAAYHLTPGKAPCPCEIDHLVPLEGGGANDITNLWPQSYITKPYNAHVKDALENKLHKLVCAGTVDLATVQKEIASDWIAAYKKYMSAK